MSDEKMPAFSTKRKRRVFKKKRYSSTTSSSSGRILKASTYGPERKCQDTPTTLTAFAAAGNLALLNGLFQGVDINQHLGRKACLKSLLFRGVIQHRTYTNTFGEMLRVLIVYDRQSSSGAPTVGDIIQDVNAAGYDEMSFMNVNNVKRFAILAQHKWYQEAIAGGGPDNVQETNSRMVDVAVPYSKIGNLPMEFTGGSTGTVADITTGAIYALFIGASGNYSCKWKCRVKFCDL